MVFLLVYVDDLFISGNSVRLVNELKNGLQSDFKIKDLGDLSYFLGIEIARFEKGLVMSQRKYALELISYVGLSGVKIC